MLATEAPVDCDIVIAVPDSGHCAAQGNAAKAGVPFKVGLYPCNCLGETIMEPSQDVTDSDFGFKVKIIPEESVLEGKRVVVADDWVERGTTSSKIVRWLKIVKMVKEAGAEEVHMRIAGPPVIGPSSTYGVEEIRKFIGPDSLAFVPSKSVKELLGDEAAKLNR
ncbi:hypothetical protein MRB53_019239 [Persea americana]|uniref:Uncharacterized protein n=1 Tax=Persea americana TaxID=3435 RepID=A0ACC2KXH0_PERAE|nr:hypothetical protein MRB53_019239 [Persea americana]